MIKIIRPIVLVCILSVFNTQLQAATEVLQAPLSVTIKPEGTIVYPVIPTCDFIDTPNDVVIPDTLVTDLQSETSITATQTLLVNNQIIDNTDVLLNDLSKNSMFAVTQAMRVVCKDFANSSFTVELLSTGASAAFDGNFKLGFDSTGLSTDLLKYYEANIAMTNFAFVSKPDASHVVYRFSSSFSGGTSTLKMTSTLAGEYSLRFGFLLLRRPTIDKNGLSDAQLSQLVWAPRVPFTNTFIYQFSIL